MKECDNCAYSGWLNGKDVITEICTKCRYICGEPTKWKAKPMTNADRIRAMSDEELAGWLARTQIANVAEALAVAKIPYELEDGLKDEVAKECLEWLKQPAEVDNDN